MYFVLVPELVMIVTSLFTERAWFATANDTESILPKGNMNI